MLDDPKITPRLHFSPAEWLRIHNGAARDYRNGEWSREALLGMRSRRSRLFGQAEGRVLDVACGYGMNFGHLTGAAGITGVDFSPVMLAMAREHARSLGLTVDLREGNAEALDFPDNAFDTVVSALSTCSFLNPVAALREMGRVCKPGGRILLLEHGRSRWGWIAAYQDRRAAQMVKESGCHWNREPQELVRAAGLDILHAERALLGILYTIEASPAKTAAQAISSQ